MGNIKSPSGDGERLHRLEFIEARLFWTGKINRGDISKFWKVSGTIATKDLQRYETLAPGNLQYDVRKKTYVASATFKPMLGEPNAERIMQRLVEGNGYLGNEPKILQLNHPVRDLDVTILRNILLATTNKQSIQIAYQALGNPEVSWLDITPRCFLNDGRRWHLRAYCSDSKIWDNFVLGRILECKLTGSAGYTEEDIALNETVTLVIRPDPRLDRGQRKCVENDFMMTDGISKIRIQKPLLEYFENLWSLKGEVHSDPLRQQVVVEGKN